MGNNYEIVYCCHGKSCYIKTGLKNASTYLKSFYVCSLASGRCNFYKKAELKAIKCPNHPENYVELCKPFIDSSTKEKRLSYRCLTFNVSKKWCGNMSLGLLPLHCESDESKLVDKMGSSKSKIPDAECSEHTLPREIGADDGESTNKLVSNLPSLNKAEEIKSSLNVEKEHINQKSGKVDAVEIQNNSVEPISNDFCIKTYSISELEKNLAAQKNLLLTINKKKLPDGGDKIKNTIERMTKTLEILKLEAKDHEMKSEGTIHCLYRQYDQSEENTKYVDPPHGLAQHKNYESRPKELVLKQTGGEISKAINSLHMQLESCPSSTDEVDGPKCLNIDLMLHQRQALAWLTWREFQVPRGGILADDMGLGKTLTMISLILKQKEVNDVATSKWFDKNSISCNSTLVVCPASLVQQWKNEIENRVMRGCVTVFLYQGPSRKEYINKLLESDIVLTTYNIISSEVGAGNTKNHNDKPIGEAKSEAIEPLCSPLLRIHWHRIILDEGHAIKNPRSVTAMSACRLKADVRWIMSGTPIHNDLSDVFSLLKFLKCSPFDNFDLWKRQVDNKSKYGQERLNTIIKVLMLRRTKDQKCSVTGSSLVSLPQRNYEVHTISLSKEEMRIYDVIFAKSKAKMQEYFNARDKKENSKSLKINSATQILLMLLRLRQSCCHPYLMKEIADMEDMKVADLEVDLADQMSAMSLTAEACHDESMLTSLYDIKLASTKIKYLIEIMDKVRQESVDLCTVAKSVVVSQWTKMLGIVNYHLSMANYRCCTISGDISAQKRSEIIDDFNLNPEGPEVMLLSLRAGGTGLNLVGGNHLYIIDMHWNPALESQACDRIYRVGQRKNVFIHKFVCKDTIEEKILHLQQRKTNLASNVLAGVGDPASKLSLRDLRVLFGIESRYSH